MNDERIKRLSSIGFQWQGRDCAKDWLHNYDRLKCFSKTFGNLDLSQDNELGKWLKYQINLKRKGLLSSDKIRKLEELGIQWKDTTTNSKDFEQNFEKLKEFVNENGHPFIPEGHYLFLWIKMQRKAMKQNLLPKYKIKMFESLGYDFLSSRWDSHFKLLQDLCEQTGNIACINDVDMLDWIMKQRQSYFEGKLKPEKIRLLESIGFKWNEESDSQWNQKFEQLETYIKANQEGPFMIDKSLYTWFRKQVVDREHRILSKERLTKLDSLGIWDRIHDAPKKEPVESMKVNCSQLSAMKIDLIVSKNDQERDISNTI